MTDKLIGIVIGLLIVCVVLVFVLNAHAFDFDARIAALTQNNAQIDQTIDQAIAQHKQDIQELLLQKLANVGAIAAFREVQAEKVEEK